MKAKQIIRKAAAYLGREDVIKFIDTPDAEQIMPQTEETVSAMVLLLNMVISELCASLVPMITEEVLRVASCSITVVSPPILGKVVRNIPIAIGIIKNPITVIIS